MTPIRTLTLALLVALAACSDDAASDEAADTQTPDTESDTATAEDAGDPAEEVGSVDVGGEDTDDPEVDDGPRRCNGHAALCDRTLQEIALAGTHNAMSSNQDGFVGFNQNLGLQRQLGDGIRAFLLDTHKDGSQLRFCHGNCFFGSTDAVEQLSILRNFLDEHPNEFLVIIFEDAISVDDTLSILADSRLDELVWEPPADPTNWPTLGELLDDNLRLVVTLESGRPGPPWLLPAWELFFDTPYTFETVNDFTCRLNRGTTENPLFLVNHWLGRPLPFPDLGDEANTLEVLWQRVQDCQQAHDHLPNIVAVDFYDQGALLQVVNRLNGVEEESVSR